MFQMFTPIEPHLRPISSLTPECWRNLLQHYPDSRFPELLSDIATYGARMDYERPFLCTTDPNHSSVFRISDDIAVNIQAEVSAGKVLILSSLPQFYIISPLDMVGQFGTSTIRHKDILISILTHLHNTHDDINIRVAFCTVFAAFLRLGEFIWVTWISQ
jgi:hypothetical protein